MMTTPIPEIHIVEKNLTTSIFDRVTPAGFLYDIDIVFGVSSLNIIDGYIRTIPKRVKRYPEFESSQFIINIDGRRFYVPDAGVVYPSWSNKPIPQILHIRNAEELQ